MNRNLYLTDIAIIGGGINGHHSREVEVISILNESACHVDIRYPSLPKQLFGLSGARIPNGNLIVSGETSGDMYGCSTDYFLFKRSLNQWIKIGPVSRTDPSFTISSRVDRFSYKGLNGKMEMPIELYRHTATVFGKHKVIICGGVTQNVSIHF